MRLNKKRIIVIISALALLAIVIYAAIYSAKTDEREEQKLYDQLNVLASNYYKDYYYNLFGDNDTEIANRISQYKDTGITISLNDLAKYKIDDYSNILSSYKNYKTGSNCDYDNTKVTFYPYEPYGRNDFRIESTVVCGFNK